MSPASGSVLEPPRRAPTPARPRRRMARPGASLLAQGRPLVWLTASGLIVCLCMVVGLLALVVAQGLATFWPAPLVRLELADGGALLGEVSRVETFTPGPEVLAALPDNQRATFEARTGEDAGQLERRLVRTGNYDVDGEHFRWVSELDVVAEERPEWALLVERLSWGDFIGLPQAYLIDGAVVSDEPERLWSLFAQHHPQVRARWQERRELELHAVGELNAELETQRLALRETELAQGVDSAAWRTQHERFDLLERERAEEFTRLGARIQELDAENARHELELISASGTVVRLPLAEIVRAFAPNRLGLWAQVQVYASRWWEFLSQDPREANSEGGVFPAIFGTLVMTLLMTIVAVPIGVLAAIYLREYARAGLISSAVRIAINNLAGVPSIVFGVFGLGFFCYMLGGTLDSVFFSAKLPSPTFGTGGILWASLTLALLTLPVVIVATEEALAAVPNSMREGSYACGASQWQTILRIVLPRALPGITTGMILAIARGAGEVAPLMLVGAVKLAPALPVDGTFPYVHAERSFMHLGFHIFDLGFQSQNSEAAKPMVFTTTLLLIALIVLLNLAAIALRARLQRRFKGTHI